MSQKGKDASQGLGESKHVLKDDYLKSHGWKNSIIFSKCYKIT